MKTTILRLASVAVFGGAVVNAAPPGNDGNVRPVQRLKVLERYPDSTDVSGAVMVAPNRLVVVGDEGGDASLMEIDWAAGTLGLIDTIPLPKYGATELDAEAIALVDREVVIAGSHGISRKSEEYQPSRYRAVRFPIGADGTMAGAASVFTFSEALKASPATAPFYREKLKANGVNIEGLAWANNRFYVGMRSPNVGDSLVILEVARDGSLCKTWKLPIGPGFGVRAIEPVEDGFLILAGGSSPDSEHALRPATVFHWDGRGTYIEPIGILAGVVGKPEALVSLGMADGCHEVLVFSDGGKKGGPKKYRLLPRLHRGGGKTGIFSGK